MLLGLRKMPVESNIDEVTKSLEGLPVSIQRYINTKAMNAVRAESVSTLRRYSLAYRIRPSYVTGQDRFRSKKQKRENARYGRSITNWQSLTYESEESSGSIAGSPRNLGWRAWMVERGTKKHVMWNKYVGEGAKPRPFYLRATEHMQRVAPEMIATSVNKLVKLYNGK